MIKFQLLFQFYVGVLCCLYICVFIFVICFVVTELVCNWALRC